MADEERGEPSLPASRRIRPEPIVVPLSSPTDPLALLARLARLPGSVLLDSASTDGSRDRYTYLSAAPVERIRARGSRVVVTRPISADIDERRERVVLVSERDPFAAVAERLAPWAAPRRLDLPPLQGGAIGLFGYGLSRITERLPASRRDEFGLPDLDVGIHDWIIAIDRHAERAWLVVQDPGPDRDDGTPRAPRARADAVLARLVGDPQPLPAGSHPATGEEGRLELDDLAPVWPLPGRDGVWSGLSRESYVGRVSRVVEYIRAGDVFQVNLSQRLLAPARRHPAELYGDLRAASPAPYAGYLDGGEWAIASSSPEHFLTVRDREVVTHPIKGTRPRGRSPEEDAALRRELESSEKDRAENVMIVDLLRNDLSRVCEPGSVSVPELCEVESHPTVHHLVSEVRGRLEPGRSALDLLRACFPGGSITGAPKVRAMEIIAELEPTERGPYCGSLAAIGFDGSLEASILIRTVTVARGWLQLPVGGGVIADSSPEAEYQETLDKAAGMLRALDLRTLDHEAPPLSRPGRDG